MEEKCCFPVKTLLSIRFVCKHFENKWSDPIQLRMVCHQIILGVDRLQVLSVVYKNNYTKFLDLDY